MLFAKTGCWRAVGEVMERDGWRAVKWWEMAESGEKAGLRAGGDDEPACGLLWGTMGTMCAARRRGRLSGSRSGGDPGMFGAGGRTRG